MTAGAETNLCDFCKTGTVVTTREAITFYQWTSRGYVRCNVIVPVGICSRCRAKSLSETAEADIEEAVRREIEKLR
jgi:hypothetical protein